MADIINLLPDSVANQIAAGEVIQRPASAVKELLENAVDAGADDIKLIIKDAGKTLIQVVDNGCGMSPTDARMSLERHATSKITSAEDLFQIKTKGFRGEALASIAAIAQMDIKTCLHDNDMGTHISVEGSKVKFQQEELCSPGTSIAIRNLFFNTPARRNFLKSDMQELRHITEEFYRVAMIHPNIRFSFMDGTRQKFLLNAGNLKQRIVALFGKNFTQRLLDVEEKTTVVEISGYVGKPETSRKTRGEQYFFVNERYIRHPYLNHAVMGAFEDLIPEGYFPSYFLHLKVDPQLLDVNIHPTKTEVNFRDEKAIYSILRAAVKMSLGKFALSPQLDFDLEQSIDLSPPPPGTPIRPPQVKVDPNYNPFEQEEEQQPASRPATSSSAIPSFKSHQAPQDWRKMFEQSVIEVNAEEKAVEMGFSELFFRPLSNTYLIAAGEHGIWVVNRQAAHERVLYDRFAAISVQGQTASQRKIFPDRIAFSAPDTELIRDLQPDLIALGFEFNYLENNEIEVIGAPPDLVDEPLGEILEGMLEYYKLNRIELRIDKRKNLILSMARNLSIRPGQSLSEEENKALIEALAESAAPEKAPSGKVIIQHIPLEDIHQMFKI
jgi:DNA mismatch repair protein MutL